jgi:hypothetical protein
MIAAMAAGKDLKDCKDYKDRSLMSQSSFECSS